MIRLGQDSGQLINADTGNIISDWLGRPTDPNDPGAEVAHLARADSTDAAHANNDDRLFRQQPGPRLQVPVPVTLSEVMPESRHSVIHKKQGAEQGLRQQGAMKSTCLLYTSDAADE